MRLDLYLSIMAVLSAALFYNCGLDPEEEPLFISYDSRLTSGCIREIPYDQITNQALLTWRYTDNNLELYINLDTHCFASLKDSIRVVDNNISIFLSDTTSQTSACGCIYREVYYFKVSGYEEAFLHCFFMPYAEKEYNTVINQRLQLTPLR